MTNEVYHLVSVKDGTSDTASIVKVFAEMAEGRLDCDLKLLNYYDEIPVSYGTSIAGVAKDSLELVVHEHQAAILKHDNNTLIKSKHFHNSLGVHCYAAQVNVPEKTVVLHNFAYAQIRAERREMLRVRVRERLPVRFSCSRGTVEGRLATISGAGLSITTDNVPAINADQPGQLFFKLAGTPLAMPGSFVRYGTHETNAYSCLFMMKPNRITEEIISRFIYQRQVEIIQHLKDGLAGK